MENGKKPPLTYKDAGVDIDAGEALSRGLRLRPPPPRAPARMPRWEDLADCSM
jgi:hypothetical protein